MTSGHLFPAGMPVEVWRCGVLQGAGVITRLDRNLTYRVRDARWDTTTSYCEDELVPVVGA